MLKNLWDIVMLLADCKCCPKYLMQQFILIQVNFTQMIIVRCDTIMQMVNGNYPITKQFEYRPRFETKAKRLYFLLTELDDKHMECLEFTRHPKLWQCQQILFAIFSYLFTVNTFWFPFPPRTNFSLLNQKFTAWRETSDDQLTTTNS